MAWWDIVSGGLHWASAGLNLEADKTESKLNRAWQKYSNTMIELSHSTSANAITTNEILSQHAFADQALVGKKTSILTQAKVEVAAAAAGVKGRSVNQAMFDVQRNAGAREAERQRSLSNANLAFDQQRLMGRMSANMQKDYSPIPKPNAASYYLNAGIGMMNSWMDRPQGSRGSNLLL